MQDGGEQNREFVKIHFENECDAKLKNYMSESLINPTRKIAHSQDFSHNMKKLRNAVYSSGIHKSNTRTLVKGEHQIVWDQWINAAKWDEDTNSRKIHYKLTPSHLHPDSAEKMRNHLAEEVLDEDMCHLVKHYRKSLQHCSVLDSAVEFLENTSKLISVFRDRRPILSYHDTRLESLRLVLQYFMTWREEVDHLSISQKEKEKRLPSKKCLDEVSYQLLQSFVKFTLQNFQVKALCLQDLIQML